MICQRRLQLCGISAVRVPLWQGALSEDKRRALLRKAVAAYLQQEGSATGQDLAAIYGGGEGSTRLQAVLHVRPCTRPQSQ